MPLLRLEALSSSERFHSRAFLQLMLHIPGRDVAQTGAAFSRAIRPSVRAVLI